MLDKNLLSKNFKRSPEKMIKYFTSRKDSIAASDSFYIVFPERYINKSLVSMGSVVKLLSIYAMVNDKLEYSTISAPIMVDIVPDNVETILIDGVPNIVLEIYKGTVFIPNRDAVRSPSFMYNLFDEFLLQGKVPWFMSYDDLSNIFALSNEYANSGVGDDPLSMEIIASMIARDPNDKLVGYREIIKSNKTNTKPAYVGLNNVYYSYDNTAAKIMGGYMKVGVTTAIVNKEETSTKTSILLRK